MNDEELLDKRAPHMIDVFSFDASGNIDKYDANFTFSTGRGIELVGYLHWVLDTDPIASSSEGFFMRLRRLSLAPHQHALPEYLDTDCFLQSCEKKKFSIDVMDDNVYQKWKLAWDAYWAKHPEVPEHERTQGGLIQLLAPTHDILLLDKLEMSLGSVINDEEDSLINS